MSKKTAGIKSREPGSIGIPLGLIGAGVVAFLIIPVGFVIFYSFNKEVYFVFPPKEFTIEWYKNFFSAHFFRHSSVISLGLAAAVTPLSTIIAIAASYGLVRGRFKGASTLNALLLSPVIIPGVITGMALMAFFGIVGMHWSFLNLVIAMTLVCLPYAVRTISANLHGLNPSIEEAAINLGASRWTTFLQIVLPQIRPGILGSMVFVLATVLTDVSVSIFLTDYGTSTLAITTLGYMRHRDDPTVAAVAALLIALTVVLVLLVERFIGLEKFMTLD
jgi:putative spermidine/putrescine transport system permease protein